VSNVFALFTKHTVPNGDVAQSRWELRKAEKVPRLGGRFPFGTIARLPFTCSGNNDTGTSTNRIWVEYGTWVYFLAKVTPGGAYHECIHEVKLFTLQRLPSQRLLPRPLLLLAHPTTVLDPNQLDSLNPASVLASHPISGIYWKHTMTLQAVPLSSMMFPLSSFCTIVGR
jgi:hypothetical protein